MAETFESAVGKSVLDKIKTLYSKISKDDEFESALFTKNYKQQMSLLSYLHILKYLSARARANKNEKLVNKVELDIIYTASPDTNFRITINGIEAINKYMEMLHSRKNHVIFSTLIAALKKDNSIRITKKVKKQDKTSV